MALRSTLGALVLAAASLGVSASPSAAQAVITAGGCKGKIFINSIYTNGIGENQYEYFVQIQNRATKPVRWIMNFGGFPSRTVSLFSPQLVGTPLAPYAQETIKFGKGTDGNITFSTVQSIYDGPPMSNKPFARVSACLEG